MKKLFITLCVLIITLSLAQAQTLKAPSMQGLIDQIQETEFSYKEKGMVFGFNTIQSCLFLGKDIAIFKNYCFPERNYPARGYTIISKKYGMIDLYEETLPSVVKRDFQITQFQEILLPYLTTPISQHNLNGLSDLIAKLHYQRNPGCWSTNYSFYTEGKDFNCSVSSDYVEDFATWSADTQAIANDLDTWYALIKAIDSKLIR